MTCVEIWKPINNYDNLYVISNYGRVKRTAGGAGARVGLILKPQIGRRGYSRVGLWKNGKCARFLLHRLVAANFISESCMQINHIDGDKSNNFVENLEYVTAMENITHAVSTGLRNTKGINNQAAKLNDEKVRSIRNSDLTGRQLAKQYGVTQRVICLVKNGLAWRHVI